MLQALVLLALLPFTLCRPTEGKHIRILSSPPPPLPPRGRLRPDVLVHHAHTGEPLSPLDTVYTFDQLIDHDDPGLGSFEQRFWFNWEFYEPGGPIVLTTPGETNAEGYTFYLTNETIVGQIAQQQHGAAIVLEHRFYGFSNPFQDLSVASLQYHTIQQAIDDLEYFANTVQLPMPNGDHVSPSNAPWVLVGGSYAGALTAFTKVNKPDVFYAAYASSAVVQSITDFWAYFEPIRQNMPKNCSADVEAVIVHVDNVFSSGNDTQIAQLKATFGLGDVVYPDDVARALRINLYTWQSLSPSSGGAIFYDFCDALEVVNGQSAGASGRGLTHALAAWGSYFSSVTLVNLCSGYDAEACFGTHGDNPYWTDTSINNADRSWTWITCNEVGFFQDSAPSGYPGLVSRALQPGTDERLCQRRFPEAFSTSAPPRVDRTNAAYDGWNLQAERLFFANGQRDPWLDATVSAGSAPAASTPAQPIAVSGAFHCSDMVAHNGLVDPSVGAVQAAGLDALNGWLADWAPPAA